MTMHYAHYKRFLELFIGDPAFRAAFKNAPARILDSYHLDLAVEDLRPLYDREAEEELQEQGASHAFHRMTKAFDEQCKDRELLQRLEPESFKNAQFSTWRNRQQQRIRSQTHKMHSDLLLHIPFAFELSAGCSVQCPFCAFAPPPLKDVFRYTPEHATLWKDILSATREILGPAAGASACYFATEPFDNPDYEKFCEAFFDIHGYWTQTTTVKHLEQIERTRAFLSRAHRHNPFSCRFSVTSLSMLKRLHAEFTAEELANVPFVLNNKGSLSLYCRSGRATAMSYQQSHPEKFYQEGTSCCLSGFLVNMLERRIRLIVPCNPSETWPLGYAVLAEADFVGAEDFTRSVEDMISRRMPAALTMQDVVRFRPDIRFESNEEGFEVSTRFLKRRFRAGWHIKRLGELVAQGTLTVKEILEDFHARFVPSETIRNTIDTMFNGGLLDDEIITGDFRRPEDMYE